MRSLGSITLFFPYVDDDTRKILHSTMIEADDFDDFSDRLCKIVFTTDTPVLLQYLNFIFASYRNNQGLIKELESEDKIHPIVRPFLSMMKMYNEGEEVKWNEMTQLLADAVENAPNEWFVCHLYLFWRYWAAEVAFFPPSDYKLHPYESVVVEVQNNPDLEYLRIILLLIKAKSFSAEFEISKAISSMENALNLAKKYDDRYLEGHIGYILASWIKFTDTKKALDLAIETRSIFQELGSKNGLSLIQNLLGHTMGMRGEYDAAIEHHRQARDIFESLSIPTIVPDIIIATYHLLAGKAEEALALANNMLDSSITPQPFMPDIRRHKAWALVILERNKEARAEFEEVRKLALKSGETQFLVQMEILEGLLDKSEGNIDTAADIFRRLLVTFRENPMPLYQNICLLNLVDIEIKLLHPEIIDSAADTSGEWMIALNEHLSRFNLPGIAAQAKLLLAAFRNKQSRYEEANMIIQGVLETSKSPSMKYLREIILRDFSDYIPT